MSREFAVLYVSLVILALALGLIGGYLLFSERGSVATGHSVSHSAATAGPELPPTGLRIAQGWKCMCGACRDDLLDCHCDDPNGAHEIKAALRELITAGRDEDAIRKEMAGRYGPRLLGTGGPEPEPPPAPKGS